MDSRLQSLTNLVERSSSETSSEASTQHYVSVIKCGGRPILPPVLTPQLRLEMQEYKNQAKDIERKLLDTRRKKLIQQARNVLENFNNLGPPSVTDSQASTTDAGPTDKQSSSDLSGMFTYSASDSSDQIGSSDTPIPATRSTSRKSTDESSLATTISEESVLQLPVTTSSSNLCGRYVSSESCSNVKVTQHASAPMLEYPFNPKRKSTIARLQESLISKDSLCSLTNSKDSMPLIHDQQTSSDISLNSSAIDWSVFDGSSRPRMSSSQLPGSGHCGHLDNPLPSISDSRASFVEMPLEHLEALAMGMLAEIVKNTDTEIVDGVHVDGEDSVVRGKCEGSGVSHEDGMDRNRTRDEQLQCWTTAVSAGLSPIGLKVRHSYRTGLDSTTEGNEMHEGCSLGETAAGLSWCKGAAAKMGDLEACNDGMNGAGGKDEVAEDEKRPALKSLSEPIVLHKESKPATHQSTVTFANLQKWLESKKSRDIATVSNAHNNEEPLNLSDTLRSVDTIKSMVVENVQPSHNEVNAECKAAMTDDVEVKFKAESEISSGNVSQMLSPSGLDSGFVTEQTTGDSVMSSRVMVASSCYSCEQSQGYQSILKNPWQPPRKTESNMALCLSKRTATENKSRNITLEFFEDDSIHEMKDKDSIFISKAIEVGVFNSTVKPASANYEELQSEAFEEQEFGMIANVSLESVDEDIVPVNFNSDGCSGEQHTYVTLSQTLEYVVDKKYSHVSLLSDQNSPRTAAITSTSDLLVCTTQSHPPLRTSVIVSAKEGISTTSVVDVTPVISHTAVSEVEIGAVGNENQFIQNTVLRPESYVVEGEGPHYIVAEMDIKPTLLSVCDIEISEQEEFHTVSEQVSMNITPVCHPQRVHASEAITERAVVCTAGSRVITHAEEISIKPIASETGIIDDLQAVATVSVEPERLWLSSKCSQPCSVAVQLTSSFCTEHTSDIVRSSSLPQVAISSDVIRAFSNTLVSCCEVPSYLPQVVINKTPVEELLGPAHANVVRTSNRVVIQSCAPPINVSPPVQVNSSLELKTIPIYSVSSTCVHSILSSRQNAMDSTQPQPLGIDLWPAVYSDHSLNAKNSLANVTECNRPDFTNGNNLNGNSADTGNQNANEKPVGVKDDSVTEDTTTSSSVSTPEDSCTPVVPPLYMPFPPSLVDDRPNVQHKHHFLPRLRAIVETYNNFVESIKWLSLENISSRPAYVAQETIQRRHSTDSTILSTRDLDNMIKVNRIPTKMHSNCYISDTANSSVYVSPEKHRRPKVKETSPSCESQTSAEILDKQLLKNLTKILDLDSTEESSSSNAGSSDIVNVRAKFGKHAIHGRHLPYLPEVTRVPSVKDMAVQVDPSSESDSEIELFEPGTKRHIRKNSYTLDQPSLALLAATNDSFTRKELDKSSTAHKPTHRKLSFDGCVSPRVIHYPVNDVKARGKDPVMHSKKQTRRSTSKSPMGRLPGHQPQRSHSPLTKYRGDLKFSPYLSTIPPVPQHASHLPKRKRSPCLVSTGHKVSSGKPSTGRHRETEAKKSRSPSPPRQPSSRSCSPHSLSPKPNMRTVLSTWNQEEGKQEHLMRYLQHVRAVQSATDDEDSSVVTDDKLIRTAPPTYFGDVKVRQMGEEPGRQQKKNLVEKLVTMYPSEEELRLQHQQEFENLTQQHERQRLIFQQELQRRAMARNTPTQHTVPAFNISGASPLCTYPLPTHTPLQPLPVFSVPATVIGSGGVYYTSYCPGQIGGPAQPIPSQDFPSPAVLQPLRNWVSPPQKGVAIGDAGHGTTLSRSPLGELLAGGVKPRWPSGSIRVVSPPRVKSRTPPGATGRVTASHSSPAGGATVGGGPGDRTVHFAEPLHRVANSQDSVAERTSGDQGIARVLQAARGPNVQMLMQNEEIRYKLRRLPAIIKGYLVRRLIKTEKVQILIHTLVDTAQCIVELQQESPVKRGHMSTQDKSLRERLLNQITGVMYEIHEIFVDLPVKDRMAIIEHDRRARHDKQFKVQQRAEARKKRLSTATLKSLERKRQIQDIEKYAMETFSRPRPQTVDRGADYLRQSQEAISQLERYYSHLIDKSVRPKRVSGSPVKSHKHRGSGNERGVRADIDGSPIKVRKIASNKSKLGENSSVGAKAQTTKGKIPIQKKTISKPAPVRKIARLTQK